MTDSTGSSLGASLSYSTTGLSYAATSWLSTTPADYYDYVEALANSTATASFSFIASNATTTTPALLSANVWAFVNLLLKYYRATVLPLAILVGVFTNCFVLYIFSRHSVGVSRSTRVYYVLLAFVDCTSLLTYNLTQFLSFGLNTISSRTFNIKIETISDFVCGLNRYVFYLSEALSNYFYMLFSIERLVAIHLPFKARKIFSKRNSTLIILLITAVHAVVYLDIFWVYNLQLGICTNRFASDLLRYTFQAIVIPNSHFVPTFANMCLNAAIVVSIQHAARRRSEMTAVPAGGGQAEETARRKQALVAMTIAIVQFLHIAIYMPSGVSWLFLTLIQIGDWDDQSNGHYTEYLAISAISNLFLTLTSVGHCISFFVYLFRMPVFRRHVFSPCVAAHDYYSVKFSTASEAASDRVRDDTSSTSRTI